MKLKIKKLIIIICAIFLFIFALSIFSRFANGNNKKPHILQNLQVKNRNISGLNLNVNGDAHINGQGAVFDFKSHSKKHSEHLNDIFDIPNKKYPEYSKLLILHSKSKKNLNGGSMAANQAYFMKTPPGFQNVKDLNKIVKNLKFKGFSKKNNKDMDLIFTGGKIAMIRIDGKSHYIHAGENIEGIFILKVEPSKIIYTRKGEILYKYLND